MFESRFEWHHPYGWRTNLRSLMPRPICWLFDKGRDCEVAGGEHHWYNTDDKHSACYYCRVIREGQLWK